MIGRHGAHARRRGGRAAPLPIAGTMGSAGRPPAAHPEAGLPSDPDPENTWLRMHERRIRILDTLTPAEMLDILIYLSGNVPREMYVALQVIVPQLFEESVR